MTGNDCIFCKIVAGEIPCAKLEETATTLAFLDIAPVRPGHALVIPKAHHETLFDLPAELAEDLLAALQRVGRATMDATGASGLNLGMNCYKDAGQLVFHAHYHLIPRQADDGLSLWGQSSYAAGEMDALAEKIRAAL